MSLPKTSRHNQVCHSHQFSSTDVQSPDISNLPRQVLRIAPAIRSLGRESPSVRSQNSNHVAFKSLASSLNLSIFLRGQDSVYIDRRSQDHICTLDLAKNGSTGPLQLRLDLDRALIRNSFPIALASKRATLTSLNRLRYFLYFLAQLAFHFSYPFKGFHTASTPFSLGIKLKQQHCRNHTQAVFNSIICAQKPQKQRI